MKLDSTSTGRELADAMRRFATLTAGDDPRDIQVTINVPDGEPIAVDMAAITAAWLLDAVQAEIDSLTRDPWRD